HEDVVFTLPPEEYGHEWRVVVDTHSPPETPRPSVPAVIALAAAEATGPYTAGSDVTVAGRSLLVVTRPSVEAL
ncbi:MAG: hypothetical protein PGN11_06575, partial [Quadrisphaera sp.]